MASVEQLLQVPLGKWRVPEEGFRKARGWGLMAHVRDVLEAAHFWMHTSTFGDQLHATLGLALPLAKFQKICMYAAYLHDFGKSGSEFQLMLRGLEDLWDQHKATMKPHEWKALARTQRYQQAYRHEALSGLLFVAYPELMTWLQGELGEHAYVAIFGAMAHHRKMDREGMFPLFKGEGLRAPSNFDLEYEHRVDLRPWARRQSYLSKLGVTPPPALSPLTFTRLDMEVWLEQMEEWPVFSEEDPLVLAVKWCTVLADVYGSIDDGGPDAVRAMYAALQQDENAPAIRFHERIEKKLKGAQLTPTQLQAGVRDNILVETPTGSGKSITGLHWCRQEPKKSLLWAMPTTDLANQAGFEYGMESKDALRHSRSLLLWRPTAGEEDEGDEVQIALLALRDAARRRSGHREVTFTTYDQILGCLAYNHASILWLPHILRSQVIFDECHILREDSQLRGYHETFLRVFKNLRVAHMSATVAPDESDRIQRFGVKVIVPTKDDVADHFPRYRLRIIPHPPVNGEYPWFKEGSLWIVNQVKTAQLRAKSLPDTRDTRVYHARFRQFERRRIREEVMAALGPASDEPKMRVIATQAVELGFDVYATSLLTEACPPASFIQRLGRCNRRPVPKGPADVWVYAPETSAPYSRSADPTFVETWLDWLAPFDGKEVSTFDLREALHRWSSRTQPVLPVLANGVAVRDGVRKIDFNGDGLLLADVKPEWGDWSLPKKERHLARLDQLDHVIPILLFPEMRKRLKRDNQFFYLDWPYDSFTGLENLLR